MAGIIKITTVIDLNDFNEFDYFGRMFKKIKFNVIEQPYYNREIFEIFYNNIIPIIEDNFYYYYIGTHPFKKWLKLFENELNKTIRNNWGLIEQYYDPNENKKINYGGEVGHKNKEINSQYPQTVIQESEAYASASTDDVGREVKTLGTIEAVKQYTDPDNKYIDVVNIIINDLSKCFSFIDF